MSGTSATVAQVEMGANLKEPNAEKINEWLGLAKDSKIIRFWRLDNLAAKPSSGSNKQAGMIIVPCSMGTLGAIASGAGTNLIHRAADVCLKEGRKLVIVPRETPYNAIHLENMLKLARAGATDSAGQSGLLSRPKTIEELVRSSVFSDFRPIRHSAFEKIRVVRRGSCGRRMKYENFTLFYVLLFWFF